MAQRNPYTRTELAGIVVMLAILVVTIIIALTPGSGNATTHYADTIAPTAAVDTTHRPTEARHDTTYHRKRRKHKAPQQAAQPCERDYVGSIVNK